MRFLSLERLEGPGKSIDENFELLCLDLSKIGSDNLPSDIHRILPPDGGIDVYFAGSTDKIAYQCKAYPHFRSDLVRAVKKSAHMACVASSKTPFDVYVLVIPFVPTREQRRKLEEALKESGAKPLIVDGDELERRLFDAPQIATRFFPSVTIIMPPSCDALQLSTGQGELINLHIESIRTGQTIPLKVSSGAQVHGVVNFLVAVLRLPNTFTINAASFVSSGDLHWKLAVVRDGKRTVLSSDETLEEAGVGKNAVLHLVFEQEELVGGGFAKRIGLHWEKISIDSDIWDGNEMNETLMKDEWQGHSDSDRFELLIDRYFQWHFERVKKNMIKV
jgi:hypothetical protein